MIRPNGTGLQMQPPVLAIIAGAGAAGLGVLLPAADADRRPPAASRGAGMSARELDAAGITDPQLRAGYEACRRLNAEHGRTYYLATLLLPPAKRPYVHALYGFARYADDIVDRLDPTPSAARPGRAVRALERRRCAPTSSAVDSTDPICRGADRHDRALGHPDRLLRRLPRLDADGSHRRPSTRPTPTCSATCAARPR